MKIGNFIVDTQKYDYLKPLWPVLENNPDGITLKQAVKHSGLNQEKMLKTIELLAGEYQTCSIAMMQQDMLKTIIQSSLTGEQTDELLIEDLANSWIFDKVMLYDRIKELKWTEKVIDFGQLEACTRKWMENKGI